MNSAAGSSSSNSSRSPFTASQWHELEHQALIFKYMMAGIPVPPDLLLPIRKSFESMASRFYHHPTLSYCSLYGKKVDPEPGRCRRTDGKKWRCSKDAYPDSKYCERHMHRGRNRSRKPVEAQTPPSQSSSTVTVPIPTSATAGGPTFQKIPSLLSVSNPQALYSTTAAANNTRLQMETASYGIGMPSKDYRYLHESKGEVDEHSFFCEASGNVRGLGVDSSLESAWGLMPSRISSFPTSKPRNGSIPQSSHSQMQTLQDLENTSITSTLPKQQHQQHCFFGSEFGPSEPVVKQEGQSLRPFFDEWPKTRDSWPDLEDERSNHNSFSTTQLSISIPMTSSNFSTTTSRSPNDK